MTAFSPTNSKLFHGNRPFVIANGKDAATIKIRLRDTDNNPIANRQVVLIADGPNVIVSQPSLTAADGTAVGYLTATSPGVITVAARSLASNLDKTITSEQLTTPEALQKLMNSSAGAARFAEALTVTFFSRDITPKFPIQEAERNVHLEWSVSRYDINDIDGIRVRITATEANNMPTKIFAYQMLPVRPGATEQVAAFDHVCSSVDLEEYPENQAFPNSRPAWFRLDYVDVMVRSREETREFIINILEDVQLLKNTLDIADDLLPGGDTWVGTPPDITAPPP
jgi:hypothetical protein